MIVEERIQDGATHISDGQGQLTFVVDGSNLERIWRDWDKYLGLLHFQDAIDSDRLAIFIHLRDAVGYFYRDRQWKSGGVTPASRRNHLLALESSLHQTISGLRDIDVRTKDFLDDDLYNKFEEEEIIENITMKLDFLCKEVSRWAQDESEIKVGNIVDTGLQDLIANLVIIYEKCSGRKAAKPYQRASKNLDYDENPYGGPFYRFCYEVMAEIDDKTLPKLPYAIRIALKTGR